MKLLTYWENSVIYRAIAGSWFLGWLISTPGENSLYYQGSYAYKMSDKLVVGITAGLRRLGRFLNTHGQTSLIINNPIGFVGLLLFFYVGFDLSLNDYNWQRIILEGLLMVSGLLMLLLKICPGIYQDSIIGRFLAWWEKTG